MVQTRGSVMMGATRGRIDIYIYIYIFIYYIIYIYIKNDYDTSKNNAKRMTCACALIKHGTQRLSFTHVAFVREVYVLVRTSVFTPGCCRARAPAGTCDLLVIIAPSLRR